MKAFDPFSPQQNKSFPARDVKPTAETISFPSESAVDKFLPLTEEEKQKNFSRLQWAMTISQGASDTDKNLAAYTISQQLFGIDSVDGYAFAGGADRGEWNPSKYLSTMQDIVRTGNLDALKAPDYVKYEQMVRDGATLDERFEYAKQNLRGGASGNAVGRAFEKMLIKWDEKELSAMKQYLSPDRYNELSEAVARWNAFNNTSGEQKLNRKAVADALKQREEAIRLRNNISMTPEEYDTVVKRRTIEEYENKNANALRFLQAQHAYNLVSDENAIDIIKSVMEMSEGQAQKINDNVSLKEKFEAISDREERRIVANVIQSFQPEKGKWLLPEAIIGAGNTIKDFAQGIGVVAMRPFISADDYQQLMEDVAINEYAFSDRRKEWGFWGNAVVGAFSSIPYMAAASVPYVGTSAVAFLAMTSLDKQIAAEGGDVRGWEHALTSLAFGFAYGQIEKMQAFYVLKGRPLNNKRFFADLFTNSRKRFMALGRLGVSSIRSGSAEALEEAAQKALEETSKQLYLGEDVGTAVREAGKAAIQEAIDAFGSMMLIGVSGELAHRAPRKINAKDIAKSKAIVDQMEQNAVEGVAQAVDIAKFSDEFQDVSRDWLDIGDREGVEEVTDNNGNKTTLTLRQAMLAKKYGCDADAAIKLDNIFKQAWELSSGTEEGRNAFVGKGFRVISMREMLEKSMLKNFSVTTDENGNESAVVNIGGMVIHLRRGSDIGSGIDPDTNNHGIIIDLIRFYNRGKAQEEQLQTTEDWKALPYDVREAFIRDNRLQINGNIEFFVENKDGTRIDGKFLEILRSGGISDGGQSAFGVGVIHTALGAMPQTYWHEQMHAVFKALEFAAETDAEGNDNEAMVLLKDLAAISPGVTADERINEEAFADGFRDYMSGGRSVVAHDDSVYGRLLEFIDKKIFRNVEINLLDRLDTTRPVEALYASALTGEFHYQRKGQDESSAKEGIPQTTLIDRNGQTVAPEDAPEMLANGAQIVPQEKVIGEGQRHTPTISEALPPVPAMVDRSGAFRVLTPDTGYAIEGVMDVVDIDDIRTSDQEGYDGTLQLRNRDTISSKDQIEKTAEGLQPELLGESVTSDMGAPLVSASGDVVSGNGRTLAIKRAIKAYNTYPGYEEFVRSKANAYNLQIPEGAKHPILVRRIVKITKLRDMDGRRISEEVDTSNELFNAELANIAELSNRPAVLMRTATEQAVADAWAILSEGLLEQHEINVERNLLTRANLDFVNAFLRAVGDGSLVDHNGEATPTAAGRIKRALFAAVVGKHPEAKKIIETIVEQADELGLNRFYNGVVQAAPILLRLAIDPAHAQYDISADIADALKTYINFKNSGFKDLESYLSQEVIDPSFKRPTLTDEILREMAEVKHSAPQVASLFTRYARNAMQQITSAEDGLFGEMASPREAVWEATHKAEGDSVAEDTSRFSVVAIDNADVVLLDRAEEIAKINLRDKKSITAYLKKIVGTEFNRMPSGEAIKIGKDLPDEYTRGIASKGDSPRKVKAKAKLATGLDEAILISGDAASEPSKHKMREGGVYYRSSFKFAIPKGFGNDNGFNAYDADVLTYKAKGNEYLYDIVNIKDNSELATRMTELGISRVNSELSSTRKIVPQSGDIRNSIIGEKGVRNLADAQRVTADLEVAREMERAKKRGAQAIWFATGWQRGADGKWRYEIPDDGFEIISEEDGKLGDIIRHDALFAAYPELKEIDVHFISEDETTPYGGVYRYGQKQIEFNGSKSVLIHEIQHAIQHIEGFARGGNPEQFKTDEWKDLVRTLKVEQETLSESVASGDEAARKRLYKVEAELVSLTTGFNSPRLSYARLAGEVEARNASERLYIDNERRKEFPLSDTEDVEREYQIILGLANEEAERIRSELSREAEERAGEAVAKMDEAVEAYERFSLNASSNDSVKLAKDEISMAGMKASDDSVLSSSVRFSINYTETPDQRNKVAEAIARVTGEPMSKVQNWMDDVDSLAAIVTADKRLQYDADPTETPVKNNADYGKTLDFTSICKKRRMFASAIERLLVQNPNMNVSPELLADVREFMKDSGLVVNCGLCYVEGRRQAFDTLANGFIDVVASRDMSKLSKNAIGKVDVLLKNSDWFIPNKAHLLTREGLRWLSENHHEIAEAFLAYNNARGMQAQNLFDNDAEYLGQILKFSESTIKRYNNHGGFRIQSFSDFEAHHLLDMMQAIRDLSSKGGMAHMYTKVPEAAWLMQDTGAKVNISHIAAGKGVDAEGNLIYDNIEGVDTETDAYKRIDFSLPNVTANIVGINDDHIRAAMKSPFIGYIIPYHVSGIKMDTRHLLGTSEWSDYTDTQVEKIVKENGELVNAPADKRVNIYDLIVRDSNGNIIQKENTVRKFQKRFFEACKKQGVVPRFYQFLNTNSKGEYIYTKGYEKLIVDFKLFDANGNMIDQEIVRPDFNADAVKYIVDKYISEIEETGLDYEQRMPNDQMKALVDHLNKKGGSLKFNPGKDESRSSIVYHGTHADFTAFDHAHMGEGEGQQAYGWGTYVTEVNGIARWYAEELTKIPRITKDDLLKTDPFFKSLNDDFLSLAEEYVADEIRDVNKMQRLREIEKLQADYLEDINKKQTKEGARHIYTVDIPDDNGKNYLHWEKELGEEQAKRIVDALSKELGSQRAQRFVASLSLWKNTSEMTGQEVYNLISKEIGGSDGQKERQRAASLFLSRAGYTGVSMPAQYQSGGRKDKARNYVIFKEEDAKIVNHERFSISATLRSDIENAIENKIKTKAIIPLCNEPFMFPFLGLPPGDIVTKAYAIRKLYNRHNLTAEDIVENIKLLNDPLFIFTDAEDNAIIVMPGTSATNNINKQGDVMSLIKLEKEKKGQHYLASIYPLDRIDKISNRLRNKGLIYSKYKKDTLEYATADAPGISPDLVRAVINEGVWENVITKDDITQSNPEIAAASAVRAADEAVADLTARSSIVSLRPSRSNVSNLSMAKAVAVRHIIKGRKTTPEDYEELLAGLNLSGKITAERLMEDAKRLAKTPAIQNAIENDNGTLPVEIEKEELGGNLTALLRGELQRGVDIGADAERGWNKAVMNLVKAAEGKEYSDIVGDTGLDLVKIIADLVSEIKPAKSGERKVKVKEDGKLVKEDADGTERELDDNTDDDTSEDSEPETDAQEGLTPEQLEGLARIAAEGKLQKRRILLARMRSILAERKARENERARKKAEREEELKKRADNKEETDAEEADGIVEDTSGKTGSGTGNDQMDTEETAGQDEGLGVQFLEMVQKMLDEEKVNITSSKELALFLRVWVEDWISGGQTNGRGILTDPVSFSRYKKTIKSILSALSAKMVNPNSGFGVSAVRRIQTKIDAITETTKANSVESRTASIIRDILNSSVRIRRKALIEGCQKMIDKLLGKRIPDPLDRIERRKVREDCDTQARYLKSVITWSQSRCDKERERLNAIIEKREKSYVSNEDTPASEMKDIVSQDAEVYKARLRLSMIEAYGGLKYKTPSEIAAAIEDIRDWIQNDMEQHAMYVLQQREKKDTMAEIFQKGVSARGEKLAPESTSGNRFTNELIATLRQRLEKMLLGSGEEGRKFTDSVMEMINAGSEEFLTLQAQFRKETDALLAEACRGTACTPKDLIKRLGEHVPEKLNNILISDTQTHRMTWGNVLQLYACLCQTESYEGNIVANHREGHKAEIEKYFEEYPEFMRLVIGLREIYNRRREPLSRVFKNVTGVGMYSPDPLYMPARMQNEREGLSNELRIWRPFGALFTPRIRNTRDFDLSKDILSVFHESSLESARTIAWAERGLFLRSVFARKDSIIAMRKHNSKVDVNDFLEQLTDTVSGGYKNNTSILEKMAQEAGKLTSYAYLSWNIVSSVKQAASLPAFANILDGGYIELLKHLATGISDRNAVYEFIHSPGFIARYGEKSIGDIIKEELRNPRRGAISKVYRSGMAVLQAGDILASVVVGAGLYKAKLEQLLRDGNMAAEEAMQVSLRYAWSAVEESQQSSRPENTISFLRRNGIFANEIMKFASSPILQASHEIHAFRMRALAAKSGKEEEKAMWGKRAATAVITNHIVIPILMHAVGALIGYAFGVDDDDEESKEQARKDLFATLFIECALGQFSRYFLVGTILNKGFTEIAELFGAKPKTYSDTGIVSLEFINKTMNTAGNVFQDLIDADFDSFRDDTIKLFAGIFSPAKTVQSAYNAYSDYDPWKERAKRKRKIRKERAEK